MLSGKTTASWLHETPPAAASFRHSPEHMAVFPIQGKGDLYLPRYWLDEQHGAGHRGFQIDPVSLPHLKTAFEKSEGCINAEAHRATSPSFGKQVLTQSFERNFLTFELLVKL